MSDVRERLLRATYDCVARWGLAKTTVEDAAREAGVSRATVYRYFPGGRDELIGAVVGWEFARFFLRLYDEVHDAETLEEVMERGLTFAHNAILEHEVLQRILVTEPEILLPRMTTEANEIHKLVAAFLVPYLVRHGMAEGTDLDRAADFLARMVLSYIGSPGRWDLNDPEQVARLVRAELLAGIHSDAPVPAPTCYRHTDRLASVTCAHCDRPICTDCMMHAPVGWQCPECISSGAKKTRVIRPFGDPNRTGIVGSTNPTPVVIGLIAVNVVAFVASGFGSNSSINRFALQPIDIHYFHQYYRLFTAMFLHLDLLHIGSNMISLLIVGPAVEVMLGKNRFLTLYLIAGLGGSVCSYLLSPAGEFGAGASGAIFGVMAAYVVLAQRQRKPMGPVVVLIAANLLLGFVGNIDWRAHIGGLVIGALLALLYDYADNLRPQARRVTLAVVGSVATLGVLAVLVLAIAPGHVNLS